MTQSEDPTKLRERLRAAALYCRQAEAEASASAAAEALARAWSFTDPGSAWEFRLQAELQKAVPHLEVPASPQFPQHSSTVPPGFSGSPPQAVLGVRSRAGTRREFQAESASAAVFAVCGPSPELEPKPRQLGQPRAASKRSRACGYNRAVRLSQGSLKLKRRVPLSPT